MKLSTTTASICATVLALSSQAIAQCPDYSDYASHPHGPFSTGRYNLSYQRPTEECRTFKSDAVERVLKETRDAITDPDLARLFENTWPNTLDTAIRWKGVANGSDEELTFVITGDINAMWLRDSSNQVQSYLSVLEANDTFGASTTSIGSLFRGVINLQARYLLTSPYCNSFQPPVESGIKPAQNGAASDDTVFPRYDNQSVFECKYELDSLAAFLQVSSDYWSKTHDAPFFSKYRWKDAVKAVLDVADAMTDTTTYDASGRVSKSPYTFTRMTTRATETLANEGIGNPTNNGTGLVRSAFRPSDDSTLYQFLIPSNMQFASWLTSAADIAAAINEADLASRMRGKSESVKAGIKNHGVVTHPTYGQIYAYEIDGYGSQNIMDDANIPSLLSATTLLNYTTASDTVYQNTRSLVLSATNPYFMRGPVISAIGGPHQGPGYAWPMASVVRILTSTSEEEVVGQLQTIVSSTAGLGLIHESVNSWNESDWTRQWFSWANGLFGAAVLGLKDGEFGDVLKRSYQGGNGTAGTYGPVGV